MALRLGGTEAAFFLGGATPSAVYLGSQEVWSAGGATVPGAPTGLQSTSQPWGDTELEWIAPESDGGSPIVAYKVYFNGVDITSSGTFTSATSWVYSATPAGAYTVSAVNAVGEGPQSAPA